MSRFLYKFISAFGAGNLNLALSSGNPDLLGACGAFEKPENLCLFPFLALSVKVLEQWPHDL